MIQSQIHAENIVEITHTDFSRQDVCPPFTSVTARDNKNNQFTLILPSGSRLSVPSVTPTTKEIK